MYDGSIVISSKIDTKQFDKQIDYIEGRLEEIEYQLKQADLGFEVGDTQKLELEYEKLSNKLIDLQKQKEKVSETSLDDGGVSTANFGKGIEKITKKITRMGLAMIGIRSLYGMISSSVSRITDENPQLQAQIDAIKNAIDNVVFKLVQLVLPVIEVIVQLVSKLLKGLFGIDIYSNNFNKNMKKANGSATKIRKQLMGFDEINILNKDGTIGGLGGNVEVTTPTDVDLSNIKTKIQNWFDKHSIPIKIDYVIDAIQNPIDYIKTAWNEFIKPNLLSGPAAGAGLIFGQDSIITKALQSLGKIFFGGIPGVVSTFKDIWEAIFGQPKQVTAKELKEMKKSTNDLTKAIYDKTKANFSKIRVEYKNGLYEVKTITGQTLKLTETDFKDLMDVLGYKTDETFEEMLAKSQIATVDFTAKTKEIGTNVISTAKNIISKYGEVEKAIKDGNYELKDGFYEIKLASGQVVKYSVDEFLKLQNELNNVGEAGKNSANETKKSWFERTNEMIAKLTGKGQDGLVGATKGAFDSLPDNVKGSTKSALDIATDLIKKFTPPKKTITLTSNLDTKGLADKIRKLAKAWPTAFEPILKGFEKYGFKNGGIVSLPRLASGGIINRPGKGVPLAVGGEVSREGVIPMDNEAQMNLLGKAIAKHIPINLTNITELDGRVIARSVSQVMNEMQFASNGGVM